jgi:hypothetical protein
MISWSQATQDGRIKNGCSVGRGIEFCYWRSSTRYFNYYSAEFSQKVLSVKNQIACERTYKRLYISGLYLQKI